MAGTLGLYARGLGITSAGTEGLYARGFWANVVAAVAAPYQGKYRPEWAGALRDVGAAVGFDAEHAGALKDVGDAGR